MEAILASLLGRILAPALCPSGDDYGSGKAADIARLLSGSRKIRVGDAMTPDQVTYTTGIISDIMKTGEPIYVSLFWGAAKGYSIFKQYIDPDLCEIMAMSRLSGIAKAIKEIYSPGAVFKVLLEDVGEHLLSPNDDQSFVDRCLGVYHQTLQRYRSLFGQEDCIEFEPESVLMRRKGIMPEQALARAREFSALFDTYWHASNTLPDIEREALSEFKVLADLGWKGTLPDCARSYYTCRASTKWVGAGMDVLISRACDYLGMALCRRSYGCHNKLSASFVPYVPGIPASLAMGRFQYRVKASRTSNHFTPPWCGFAKLGGEDVSILSVNEYRGVQREPIKTEYLGQEVTLGFMA